MAASPTDDHGTYYIALGWALTGLVLLTAILRVYSRVFITRSFGSDDIAILVSVCLSFSGEILDTLAYANGLGKHEQFVPPGDFAQVLKWEFILWIMVYISFFFVRTSVMLFTLRLLPATKLWSARIVCLTLFLNFAITVFAVVTWGLVCIPFDVSYKRIYEYVPIQHCESQKVTVAAQKVNGIFACIIDVVTALIPTSLLWNIRIRRRTKIILDAIFLLGLITSGLSIGRAVTFPGDIWHNDTTWRLIESSTFSLVEEKFGIIFANCPALRQLFVYVARNGTMLPSRHRDAPNEDFMKMRTKVKLREIFWAEKSNYSASTAILGAPIHPPESELDERTRRYAEKHGKFSALDRFATFFRRSDIQGQFWNLRSTSFSSTWMTSHMRSRPSKSSTTGEGVRSQSFNQAVPEGRAAPEIHRIDNRYRAWDWPVKEEEEEEVVKKPGSSGLFSREDSHSSDLVTQTNISPESSPSPRLGASSSGESQDVPLPPSDFQRLTQSARSPDRSTDLHGTNRRSTRSEGYLVEMDPRYGIDIEDSPHGPPPH